MRQWIKAHLGLWIMTIAAVVIAAVMLVPRMQAEQGNLTYDIVADYQDYLDMAQQSGHDIQWWMELLRESGVQRVALYECTLDSLGRDPSTSVYVWDMEELMESAGWVTTLPEAILQQVTASDNLHDFVVACYEQDDLDWILDALAERAQQVELVQAEQDGIYYLFISASADRDLQKLPLGFWPDTVAMLQQAGMSIAPRTTTVENLNGLQFQEAVFRSFDALGSEVPYFFCSGDALLGYDEPEEAQERLMSYLEGRGLLLMVTEQMDQSGNVTWGGFDQLCADTGYAVVRVFNEWGYIQNRYAYYSYTGPEEITNSLFRAVLERNCRVVYLRAIMETDSDEDYIVDPEAYSQMLTDLISRLDSHGMTLGIAPAMAEVSQPVALRLLLGICAVAAAVLMICTVLSLRPIWRWILVVAGGMGVAAAMFVLPNGSKLLLNMGAGIVYPTLTMLCLLRCLRERKGVPGAGRLWLECIGGMLLCVLGALCGAVVSTAALSESAYMLEFELYRGVKLMQIVPIGLYVLGYGILLLPEQLGLQKTLARQVGHGKGSAGRLLHWMQQGLDQPVKLRWVAWAAAVVALVAVAGVAGLYYMARTGNSDTVSISSLELMFRNVLEEVLIARPRTKEFLIGIPCLMLFIYLQRRQWRLLPFFVGLGVAIGMTSFVNTFLHIRTPLYLSLARTGYAVVFGLLIGAAVIALLEIVRVVRRKGKGKRV